MKVKDLIKFLEKCDPNAECIIPVYTGCGHHLKSICEAQEYSKGSFIPENQRKFSDENIYLTIKGAAGRNCVVLSDETQ